MSRATLAIGALLLTGALAAHPGSAAPASDRAPAVAAADPANPERWEDISAAALARDPARLPIGRNTSHGCVRLTNWDAITLARMVAQGVPVVFRG